MRKLLREFEAAERGETLVLRPTRSERMLDWVGLIGGVLLIGVPLLLVPWVLSLGGSPLWRGALLAGAVALLAWVVLRAVAIARGTEDWIFDRAAGVVRRRGRDLFPLADIARFIARKEFLPGATADLPGTWAALLTVERTGGAEPVEIAYLSPDTAEQVGRQLARFTGRTFAGR
jgi:hypothetical protein